MRNIDVLGTVGFVATTPFLTERFSFSYAQMVGFNTKYLEREKVVYYEREQISWIPRGRNNLVNKLRGDWLLMLDADLEFEPDLLYQLLRIMNKYEAPVVSGLYVYKKKPFFPVCYSFNAKRKTYEVVAKWDGNPEIFQADAVGAGCLLVKKFVFDLVREKLKEEPFDVIAQMGEDFSFFDRLRRIGVGVYLAPQIRLTHLGMDGHDYDPTYINQKILTKGYTRDGK